MIKAITFDLWNTLLVEKSYTEERLKILAEALDIEGRKVLEEDLKSAYASAQRRHNLLWEEDHCHYHLSDRLDDILKESKTTLTPALKKSVMEKYGSVILDDPPTLTEGAKETVRKLSCNFRLGIISDTGITSGENIRNLLAVEGLLGFFTATIFSDETGVCKPKKEVFDVALKRLGVDAREAIHIGDLLRTDVAGAKAAGWKGVWLKIREPDNVGVTPDYTITKLSEILEIPEVKAQLS